jgi:hypothetical protein
MNWEDIHTIKQLLMNYQFYWVFRWGTNNQINLILGIGLGFLIVVIDDVY